MASPSTFSNLYYQRVWPSVYSLLVLVADQAVRLSPPLGPGTSFYISTPIFSLIAPLSSHICLRPTTVVLATINNIDFLYTCTTHLTDPGFATPHPPETAKLGDEEIRRIKEEWEQSQRRKKETKQSQSKDGKDDDKRAELAKDVPACVTPSPSNVAPRHPRFTLHREIFAMRQVEHRKRRQTSQVKEVAPRLPGVPSGQIHPSV